MRNEVLSHCNSGSNAIARFHHGSKGLSPADWSSTLNPKPDQAVHLLPPKPLKPRICHEGPKVPNRSRV